MKRGSSPGRSFAEKSPEDSPSADDPLRGGDRIILREILEEVFSDNRDMDFEECEDIFSGPRALNIHSLVCGGGGDVPIHYVAREGNANGVRLLLKAGADPNSKGEMGVSPLYWAVSHGDFEIARLLLDAGARIDVVNELGFSDLGLCIHGSQKANPKMFKLLQSYWPGIMPHDAKSGKY